MSRIKIIARVLIECLFGKESKLTILKSESCTVMTIPKREKEKKGSVKDKLRSFNIHSQIQANKRDSRINDLIKL